MADNSTTVSIRIDSDLKAQADALFADIGLNLSSAVNVFLRRAVYEQGIPFPVTRVLPNADTLQAIRDVENGVGLSKAYTKVDDMFADILTGEDDA